MEPMRAGTASKPLHLNKLQSEREMQAVPCAAAYNVLDKAWALLEEGPLPFIGAHIIQCNVRVS